MRPGVPWNVKGIEAEAREVAQLAARRAGVSLGEWLSGLIMTDGKGGSPGGYPQSQQQHQYLPGDGTFGPQPMPQPQFQPPVPGLRYPQAVPQGNQQGYAQPPHYPQNPSQFQQPPFQQQFGAPQLQYSRDHAYEQQNRGGDYSALTGGLRDLADRFDQSERRAQQAIATVNQSVAAMQDRIDAAERVKQLADAAFTSAAEALAQSARDQARAFDSLENTVRSVQKRIGDIETGHAEWPGKDSIGRLELALGQLQKRLSEMDADRADIPTKDTIGKLEATLGQLQRRLVEMEAAASQAPGKDTLSRLETSIASMRGEVADADRRTRDDITQMAKFMRDLGSRVDSVERGSTIAESVSARFDALEARSSSMFDEIRGQMSAMDGRIAQGNAAKNTISPSAFAALKGSVEGIAARLDDMGDQASAPLTNSIAAIESTLSALTSKIEQSDKRSSESAVNVNAALKALSNRVEDSDKRQSQSLNVLSRRLDESDHRADGNARDVHKSLGDFAERLDVSEKRQKDAISGLRLTVDGMVAKGVADALPSDPYVGRTSTASTSSSAYSYSPPPPPPLNEPEIPPFLASARSYSPEAPPPPAFGDDPSRQASGNEYSLSALHTILASPLSSQDSGLDASRFAPDRFDDHLRDDGLRDDGHLADDGRNPEFNERKGGDFLAAARRAAQASAERDADRVSAKKMPAFGREQAGGRNLGRLMIIALAGVAVVAGIVAVLFTLPGGGNDEGVERPDPNSSIGEILNGPTAPAVAPAARPGGNAAIPPSAEFAPLPSADETASANGEPVGRPMNLTAPPNGSAVPVAGEPRAPEFTAGTSALPGGSDKETAVASLESGAVRGDAKSQFLLSLRYSEGRGVVKDDARAASLATKAAQQGLPIAQYRLGALYERGVGVGKSLPQAKAWYEKAAKLGNRKAMHNLAVLLADTNSGKPDYKQAEHWFREGALYGLTDSQYNLAVLLEQGMGVEKNLKEAATWYSIASEQGDTGAAERLDALRKQLNPADIAMSLDAARRYKAKGLDPASNEMPNGPG